MRKIKSLKITEVEKKGEAFEVTTVKWVVPNDYDDPDRSYSAKLNGPSMEISNAMESLQRHVKEISQIPENVNLSVWGVTWKEDKKLGSFIQFNGFMAYGVEYKTQWFMRKRIPDAAIANINTVEICSFHMVDNDSTDQGELFDPDGLQGGGSEEEDAPGLDVHEMSFGTDSGQVTQVEIAAGGKTVATTTDKIAELAADLEKHTGAK